MKTFKSLFKSSYITENNRSLEDINDPKKSFHFHSGDDLKSNSLNGVTFHEDDKLKMPPIQGLAGNTIKPPSPGKKLSAGVIAHHHDGRIWLVAPKNEFGGYKHTFPKGRVDKNEHPEHAAIRECKEESGLHVRLTGYLGRFSGTTTDTDYYHAEVIGGHPHNYGKDETSHVVLVPPHKLSDYLNMPRDQSIAKKLLSDK